MMLDKPFYHRLAELSVKYKKKQLRAPEYDEIFQCLELHTNMMYAITMLKQASVLASETNDRDWQIEICAEVQKFTEDPTAIRWEEQK